MEVVLQVWRRKMVNFVIIECIYPNLDGVAYCTPRLYGIAYGF